MNPVVLVSLAVVALAVWLFVEAIDHVGKTGDIIFAVVAAALAAVAIASVNSTFGRR